MDDTHLPDELKDVVKTGDFELIPKAGMVNNKILLPYFLQDQGWIG